MDRVISEQLEVTTIRLGSYEIIRKLARGGMAELFLARGPDGLVVLKKILPKYAGSPRYAQLFLDEARLAGSLDHPNIVRAFGAGQDRGNAFFAMEYLHGQDVRSILHRAWTIGEQVPVEYAVHIASHVAAALHYAHEQRRPDGTLLHIVHRDVSPSNIIVSYDGQVKLVDFGVAKAATSSVKTRTGTLKGKISYMSPEQARGSSIDRRSDIFSLGIVLWEMVTTQRLFRGENDLQTLQLIINQPPRRPSELQPACEPELERIILRALAQDPAARYQTAAELLADLEELTCVQGLTLDPEGLASYVAQLFSPEVRSWAEARAAGVTLADHLTMGGELTIQLSESDFVEAIDLEAMAEEEDDDDEELTEIPARPPEPDTASELGPPPAPRRSVPTPPPVPIARSMTPSGPLPVVRPGTPPSTPPPFERQEATSPAPTTRLNMSPPPPMPSGVMPVVRSSTSAMQAPPPLAGVSGEISAARSSGPWPVARGSSAATPSGPFAALSATAATAPGAALDPALADRLLRRGLWVGVGVVALVIIVAVVTAIASSGSRPARRPPPPPPAAPAPAPAPAAAPEVDPT